MINYYKTRKLRLQCIADKTTVFYGSSRIHNILQDRGAIRIGAFSHLKGELLTFGHGGAIQIGNYCYIGEDSRIWSAKSINIGDRVLIAHNVNIFDNSTHPISPIKRHQQFLSIISSGHPKEIELDERPVIIGNDVWISCMSIILAGVTIGEGAIIGAGSVVTKDVVPFTIVAGNPAKFIQEILENER